MHDEFVTLYVSTDPLEVDLLEQRLLGEGLDVRVQGVRHAAAIGAAPYLFDLTVEVAGRQHELAARIVESFLEPVPLAAQDLPEELREADDDEPVEQGGAQERERLNPLFAAGVVLFFPGACHLYARRPWTALLVAVGEVAAAVALLGGSWTGWVVGAMLLSGMLLSDFVGAQLAVRAWNRGERARPGRQLLVGAAFVLLFGALAGFVGPRIPWSPPDTDTGYPRFLYDPYDEPAPGLPPLRDGSRGLGEGTGLRFIDLRLDP